MDPKMFAGAQVGQVTGGVMGGNDLEALNKALSMGYGTDQSALTGGGALRIQSLDKTMAATIQENDHFALFNELAKTSPTGTVDEWTEQSGIGGFRGAETEASVATRGVDALQLLARDHPGARIIVVSHGTLIRLTLMQALEQPVDTIRNASLNVVVHDHTGWTLDILNGEPVPAALLPTS